jgi:hypothetical protein
MALGVCVWVQGLVCRRILQEARSREASRAARFEVSVPMWLKATTAVAWLAALTLALWLARSLGAGHDEVIVGRVLAVWFASAAMTLCWTSYVHQERLREIARRWPDLAPAGAGRWMFGLTQPPLYVAAISLCGLGAAAWFVVFGTDTDMRIALAAGALSIGLCLTYLFCRRALGRGVAVPLTMVAGIEALAILADHVGIGLVDGRLSGWAHRAAVVAVPLLCAWALVRSVRPPRRK